MVLLLAVVQFVLWAHAAQAVRLAAAEGDQVARAWQSSTAAGVARARSVLADPSSGVRSGTVAATSLPAQQIQITVEGRAPSVVFGLSLPVSATAVGPLQEFRPSA